MGFFKRNWYKLPISLFLALCISAYVARFFPGTEPFTCTFSSPFGLAVCFVRDGLDYGYGALVLSLTFLLANVAYLFKHNSSDVSFGLVFGVHGMYLLVLLIPVFVLTYFLLFVLVSFLVKKLKKQKQ